MSISSYFQSKPYLSDFLFSSGLGLMGGGDISDSFKYGLEYSNRGKQQRQDKKVRDARLKLEKEESKARREREESLDKVRKEREKSLAKARVDEEKRIRDRLKLDKSKFDQKVKEEEGKGKTKRDSANRLINHFRANASKIPDRYKGMLSNYAISGDTDKYWKAWESATETESLDPLSLHKAKRDYNIANPLPDDDGIDYRLQSELRARANKIVEDSEDATGNPTIAFEDALVKARQTLGLPMGINESRSDFRLPPPSPPPGPLPGLQMSSGASGGGSSFPASMSPAASMSPEGGQDAQSIFEITQEISQAVEPFEEQIKQQMIMKGLSPEEVNNSIRQGEHIEEIMRLVNQGFDPMQAVEMFVKALR